MPKVGWCGQRDRLTAAIFYSFARFGATFGLAIFTIVRDAVANTERSHLSAGTDAPLDWTDEQLSRFRGIQAACWTAATSIFLG